MTKAFVIGHPIGHSKSPLIHRYWLEKYSISGSYAALDVTPEALPRFVGRIRDGEFAGGNVTIPHKELVIGHLDDIEPLAQKIGAVNTIVARNGKLLGRNTDYLGFLANLDAGAPGWQDGLKTAIVLGAGGAARAVLAGLIDRGVPSIALLNRTPDRAQQLAREFGASVRPGALSDFDNIAPGAALLVNTSSVGLDGSRFEGLALNRLKSGAVVTDIVYAPLITPLLEEAQALRFQTVDGLGMLLHQAAPGFAAWFGVMPEVTAELRTAVLGATA